MPTPEPSDDAQLPGRLASVAQRVAAAGTASGRGPADVRLLLATKTIEAGRIRQVLSAGYTLIGENRAQEVVAKTDDLAAIPHEVHFIGHLQRNKINQVLPLVGCVQTVDSADLGARLDRRSSAIGRTLDVLVQVNVSGEPTKSGAPLYEVPRLLADLAGCSALRVRGYMTIGLNSPDRSAVRAGYRALTEFRDDAQRRGLPGAADAVELSMGMSGDFEDAITEGATMVRVGSAVFGRRPAAF